MVIRIYHFSHEQINNGKLMQSVEANSKTWDSVAIALHIEGSNNILRFAVNTSYM